MLATRNPLNVLRTLDQIGKENDIFSSIIDELFHFHGYPTVNNIGIPNFSPALDFVDKNDVYLISVEIPGVQKEDIDIKIEDRILSIKGEKKIEKEDKSDEKYVGERYFGSFRRELKIPNDGNINSIEAQYNNGILYLTIPKIVEKEKETRKISVR